VPICANCKVYAGLNNLNIYQPVIPAGPNGATDYSKWYFKYTPNPANHYAIIAGSNTLIAKLNCDSVPDPERYATVDIIGILAGSSTAIVTQSSAATSNGNSHFGKPIEVTENTNLRGHVHKVDHSSTGVNEQGGKEKKHKVDHSSSTDNHGRKVKIRKFFGL
jgi:hypothetical protein